LKEKRGKLLLSRGIPDSTDFCDQARINYFFVGRETEVEVVDGQGVVHDCGSWKVFEQGQEFAQLLIEELTPKVKNEESARILRDLVSKRAVLAVSFAHKDARWAIIAGLKTSQWSDTNLRFDTQEEAREALKEFA
jgi:hypothetical protein